MAFLSLLDILWNSKIVWLQKDRNGMVLTAAEDIKKRCQEYIELYKNDRHDPDNHDGVITLIEPGILECG